MSYTSIEQVRSHLIADFGSAEIVFSEPISLVGSDFIGFFSGAIRAGSLRVKTIKQTKLSRISLILATDSNSLSANGVTPGSITVSSDSSLGTIYVENIDYVANYNDGTIRIKPGGNLSVSDEVVVWFCPYQLYVEGTDYRIDNDQSQISRVTAGGIGDGETVFLDYTPEISSFTDELINAGVRDANALVEMEIDPNREFGADPVLVSSATYRALEIICRAAAARELASRRGLHQTAQGWLKLGETYNELAERWLKSFRPPAISPASPAIS